MQNRDVSLDAARGVFMLLGIVLHTAHIFTVKEISFFMRHSDGHLFFDWVYGLIHAFRMPAFFLIDGYFTALSLKRYVLSEFVMNRLLRLILPTIVVWSTLNQIQIAILKGSFEYHVGQLHLWFLVDLTIATAFLMLIQNSWYELISEKISNLSWPKLVVVFSIGTWLFSFSVRASGLAYESVLFNATSLYRLSGVVPFVFAGMLMFFNAKIKNTLTQIPKWYCLVTLPLTVILSSYIRNNSHVIMEVSLMVLTFLTFTSIGSILHWFQDTFIKASVVTRFLADSSYTIFLFHYCIIAILFVSLRETFVPYWAQFLIIVVFTFVIAASIHKFAIRKVPALRLLFNGK